MNFQLLNIVIYNTEGDKRTIDLNPGSLNIITGASKTGKTALIEIIDFCLGTEKSNIPEGVITKYVEWVGLRIQIEDGQVFIARQLPKDSQTRSNVIYYDIQSEIEIPEYGKLEKVVNREALVKLLTKHIGIRENLNIPPEGHTRDPLSATIRHALFFVFQQQSEIISNKHLFHSQSEQFIPQTIKDVLPYFLGAVDDDYVSKQSELRQLKRKLKKKKRKLQELEGITDGGLSKAQSLLSEAEDLGIYNGETPTEWQEIIDVLEKIRDRDIQIDEEAILDAGGYKFEELHEERNQLIDQLERIKQQLGSAESLSKERRGYSKEASEQVMRLKSIELFDSEKEEISSCPLCNNEIENEALPNYDEIENTLDDLDSQIRGVEERSPQMDQVLRELKEKKNEIKSRLVENRESIEAIQKQNERFQNIKDINSKRAYIQGRIDLYLSSLPELEDTSDLKNDIVQLEEEIDSLGSQISDETIEEKLDSILSLISTALSKWAKRLKLEHSESPLRLDLNKLQLVADTEDGPIPMERMGSGENWVGYHLIIHFALHRWFTNKNRPCPRFLFIDQPSQAYFPADPDIIDIKDQDISGDDREAVSRMYKLAYEVTQNLSPNFQMIITDHADLDKHWFQESVIARWRGGKKLVPESWYK